ncbi:hypothetical protein [Candidatus Albibeggiatoa sp. nov. NOAA]|uniref:hypothetical protein n=1 Tax=Candidatus Albibeggiatoa sp. nov. NOAA TaxID=3162724 RepID=UPI003302D52F|nr:hypothetical protein [Thiotrichaceae bacterium]
MDMLVMVAGAVAGAVVVSKLSSIAVAKVPFKKKMVSKPATKKASTQENAAKPTTEPTVHINIQGSAEQANINIGSGNNQAISSMSDTYQVSKVIESSQPYLTKLPPLNHKTIGRGTELGQITRAVHSKKQVVAIIAFGGVGKTTLVRQWLENLKAKDYESFKHKKIFAWSFYSQGSHETQNSSVPFFEAVLPFFGAAEIPKQDEQKGELLAKLLFAEQAMLILDGLEPLQNRVDVMEGHFKDVALQQFLWAVKRGGYNTTSLILMTSRQPIEELKGFDGFKEIDLRLLSKSNGMKLLRSLQVQGTDKALQKASEVNRGHALALVLLAKLLVTQFQGHIAFRNQLPRFKGKRSDERHARRILQFYDEQCWDDTSLERRFLYLLGLFDRPMGLVEKQVLFEKATFAQPLGQLSELEFQNLVSKLEIANLLFSSEIDWDCHPIIRQYFGQRFKDTKEDLFKQAHLVLFEYYQSVPDKDHPETLEELEPLYRAVVHGCLGGEYKDALDIYRNRIRGGSDIFYATQNLGAYSQALTVLKAFFKENWLWSAGQKTLSAEEQALLLGEAAFVLMSLGYISESLELRTKDINLYKKQQNWKEISRSFRNLANQHILLGSISHAIKAAKQAIHYTKYIDSKNDFTQMHISKSYAMFGICLYLQNTIEHASDMFLKAENFQLKQYPSVPFLHELAGFYYCSLLLEQSENIGEIKQILNRGNKLLEISINRQRPLYIALNQLILTRCYQTLNKLEQANNYMHLAIANIRKSGKINLLPLFLINCANFHLQQKKWDDAKRDLDEAEGIIKRGDMKLYAVDWHLAMSHYQLAMDNKKAAIEHQYTAKQLIKVTGYKLREKDLNQALLK